MLMAAATCDACYMLVNSEYMVTGLAAMNAMVAGSDESGGGETAMTVAVVASDEQDGGRLHVTAGGGGGCGG